MKIGVVPLLILGFVANAAPVFIVSSSGYTNGSRLPIRYTCDGTGSSPALSISNVPVGTKSFAILGWDDNTSAAPLATWLAYDIPVSVTALVEGAATKKQLPFLQGKNSFGKVGFSAPCPAKDGKQKEYFIDLYALNVSSLGLKAGSSLATVHGAIKIHKISEAKLLGVYSRR